MKATHISHSLSILFQSVLLIRNKISQKHTLIRSVVGRFSLGVFLKLGHTKIALETIDFRDSLELLWANLFAGHIMTPLQPMDLYTIKAK